MLVAEHSYCVFLDISNVFIAQWLVNFPEILEIMLHYAFNHPLFFFFLHAKYLRS